MLLVVWHPVPPSIHALRDAVLAGFADAGDPLPVRSLAAPDAGPDDVEAARGLVLVTTENFGMVSGLMKDFLERIYPWFEEVPNRNPGLPYLLISKGGNDGTGAVRDVTRIVTGLRWKEALPPIVVTGTRHRRPPRGRAGAGRDPRGRRRGRRLLTTALPSRPTTGRLPRCQPSSSSSPTSTAPSGTTTCRSRPRCCAAVAELERRGVPLLVATGRRLASTREPLAQVGLAPPAIVLNGALGLDLGTPRALPPGAVPGGRGARPPTTPSSSVGPQPGRLRRRPALRRVHQRGAEHQPRPRPGARRHRRRPLGPDVALGGRRPPRRGGRVTGARLQPDRRPVRRRRGRLRRAGTVRRGAPRPLDRPPGPGRDDRRARAASRSGTASSPTARPTASTAPR